MAASSQQKSAPALEDFDWRTSVVVASSTCDDAGATPVCRLAFRLTGDSAVRQLELTAEQLDDAIDALSAAERKMASEAQ